MIPTVNKIYLQYRAKELTRDETESLLLAEIFKSPKYYGLTNPNEDEVSSFLLWIHHHIPSILEKYNPEESTFLTYFTTAIRLRYRSWRRQVVKERLIQEILDTHHYQESLENEEHFLEVAEIEPVYTTNGNQKLQPRHPLSTKQVTTILVLALRSIHSLSDSIISKIPPLTGISQDQFQRCLERIEEHIEKKKKLQQQLERKINRTYIFYQQHKQELEALDPSMSQYHIVAHQYKYKQKLLEKLRNDRKNICFYPPNKLIEEILNLPHGSVRRILRNAAKHIAQIRELLDLENK